MNEHIVTSLGEPVGNLWKKHQELHGRDGEFFVSAPLSSTPLPVFQWIVTHANEFKFWDRVRFVLMDEMMEDNEDLPRYVPVSDPASYESFANRHFLCPLQEKIGFKIPIMKPLPEMITQFDTRIDLLLLALGMQGNYANVMPGTPKETGWHIAQLTPEYRTMHTSPESTSFPGANFGDKGMSLGPLQVLEASHVAVIVSGAKKHDLVRKLRIRTQFDPKFPISIVRERQKKHAADLFITVDALPSNT
jgi:6-phosphogluconolactonase/glucosamine-6-phosphate isomerase/deaminase